MTAFRLPVLTLLTALALGGCSLPDFLRQPPQTRGNKVDDEQISQMVVGISTRQDAIALLGSPTAKASFDENTWLYISQVTRKEIAATNAVEAQNVVALTFDSGGVLRHIDRKDMADGIPVSVIARTTPSPGTDTSFLQQLFGNIGKFNPGGPGSSGGGAGRGVTGNY